MKQINTDTKADSRTNQSTAVRWSRKPLSELNLLDDFLFSTAIENEVFCKQLLEIILEKPIRSIRYHAMERSKKNLPSYRSIRLDVYIEDEEGTMYDIEMQVRNLGNLPKRSRFYQSLMDSPLLKSGERDFNQLNNSYIIFILPQDIFGKGLYRYTFEHRCLEDPDLPLGDGATRIFLNTRGTDPTGVSPTLIKLLSYIEQSSTPCDEVLSDPQIKQLHSVVSQLKQSEEMGVQTEKLC